MQSGERCVLAVIVSIDGPSAREVGAMMAVRETGEYAGYVSNGCVDADIARHALETMKVLYGSANGFGWKMNQIVGAQVVSVPATIPYQRAERAFLTFMGSLLGVFVIIAILLNLTLHGMIIRRIRIMSKLANEVSMGGTELPEFEPKGNDEITSLAQSFNRMRRSLGSAINMLDDTIYNKPPK